MNAETAYLFRHALLRDVAYQLHLPGDRARLHALTLSIFEQILGVPPPPPPLAPTLQTPFQPHPSDPVAAELAEHASLAGPGFGIAPGTLVRYLRRAADSATRDYRHQEAWECWRRLLLLLPAHDRGEGLRRAALAARAAGVHAETRRMLEESLAVSRAQGDKEGAAWSLKLLAEENELLGRVPEAEQAAEQAAMGLRAAGRHDLEAAVTGFLGRIYLQTGRARAGEQMLRRAGSAYRALGNRTLEGMSLGNLANALHLSGRVDLAEMTFQSALEVHRSLENRRSEGVVLGNLANLYNETGRPELAERTFLEALRIHREVGNRRSEGITLSNLAGLYRTTGRILLAESTYAEAHRIHLDVGDRRSVGILIGALAELDLHHGRFDQAERGFQEALAIHLETRNRRMEGNVLCAWALLELKKGQVEEARGRWLRGARVLREIGDSLELSLRSGEMRGACAQARIPPFDDDPA